MSRVQRQPAIAPRHPAEDLPGRPQSVESTGPVDSTTPAASVPQRPAPAAAVSGQAIEERLTEQHNVRVRPSTRQRIIRAVDKLRYETGDRSISIASITDRAIDQYLTEHGC